MRAQAAELRRLKAAGLLGACRSTATPRPMAYVARDEEGEEEFRPFHTAFRPVRGQAELPPAVAAAAARAAAAKGQRAASPLAVGTCGA